MATNMNLPVKSMQTARDLFSRASIQDEIAKALPGILTADRLIRVVLTELRLTPKLLECSQQSIVACLFACAQLGLVPARELGQAYFVPFKGIATFIPGYRGLVTLWRRAGDGFNLGASEVYEKDAFHYDLLQWEMGNQAAFSHIPYEGNEDPGKIRGAWAVFHSNTGRPAFDYMPWKKIEKRMKVSKAKSADTPWQLWPEEMTVKTVIKHGLKLQPISIDDASAASRIHKAAAAEDLFLAGEDQQKLFLPEEKPLEIRAEYSIEDFDAEFDDLLKKKYFTAFLKEGAQANDCETIGAFKIKVMQGDHSGFRSAFETYAKNQKPAPKKKPRSSKKSDTGGDQPDPADGQEGKKADDADDEKKAPSFFDGQIWDELKQIKEAYPDIYARITGGKDPQDVNQASKIIDAANAEIDALG